MNKIHTCISNHRTIAITRSDGKTRFYDIPTWASVRRVEKMWFNDMWGVRTGGACADPVYISTRSWDELLYRAWVEHESFVHTLECRLAERDGAK